MYKCNVLFILGNVTPNPSAIAAKVLGPETGAVPKQSATAPAPVAPPFSNSIATAPAPVAPPFSNSIYPNAFALPHHGPLQPVPASCFPNPLPVPFPATSVPNPFPRQEFSHHPPMSKYCITDCLLKGEVVLWISGPCLCLWLVASVPSKISLHTSCILLATCSVLWFCVLSVSVAKTSKNKWYALD